MYAVIEVGGKQYKVSEGDVIELQGKEGEIGKEMKFRNILLLKKDKKVESESKLIARVRVVGEVLEHKRGKKMVAFKYKKRKDYRRKKGYRQEFTKVRIKKITAS